MKKPCPQNLDVKSHYKLYENMKDIEEKKKKNSYDFFFFVEKLLINEVVISNHKVPGNFHLNLIVLDKFYLNLIISNNFI